VVESRTKAQNIKLVRKTCMGKQWRVYRRNFCGVLRDLFVRYVVWSQRTGQLFGETDEM